MSRFAELLPVPIAWCGERATQCRKSVRHLSWPPRYDGQRWKPSLAEILDIVSNEEASVKLRSHVLCFQEKFIAGLNTLGARTSLIRVDQLAPCVIAQETIPGAVEVVSIASVAHLAPIRTFRPPT